MNPRTVNPYRRVGNRQRGLSLIEVLISVMVLMAAALAALPLLSGWQRLIAEKSVDAHVHVIASALSTYYESSSGAADAEDYALALFESGASGFDSQFIPATDGPQSLATGIPQPLACRASLASVLQRLSGAVTLPPSRGLGDAARSSICLLVSSRRVAHVVGFKVPFHDVAVVSPGADGMFHPETSFDFDSGILVLRGDDQGAVMRGAPIQERKALDAIEKLARVRDVYENYFTTRFLSDISRNMVTNYFYFVQSGNGGDANPGAEARPSSTSVRRADEVLKRVLNPSSSSTATISPYTRESALVSQWGTAMEVANRPGTVLTGGWTPLVRAPGAAGEMGALPWTAVLAFPIPGGGGDADTHISTTALGRY